MIRLASLKEFANRRAQYAAPLYVVVIVGLGLTALLFVWGCLQRYSAERDTLKTLTELQKRVQTASLEVNTQDWPPGSPFLEGTSVTLANAALLQRIVSAVTHAGGTVVSSEVSKLSKDNYVKATTTCEIPQVDILQRLLHDLEAGMPFLFVDELSVEAPSQPIHEQRIRVRLVVSGLWTGAK